MAISSNDLRRRVLILRGIPNSGKSTFANKLIKELGERACVIASSPDVVYPMVEPSE